MEPLKLEITTIRAGDDPPLRSKAFQQELRAVEKTIKAEGFTVGVTIELIEAAGGNTQDMATYLGFVIELAHSPAASAIGTALGVWLVARYGRKVRLKVGDIEVEARTEKQVQRLLEQAEQFQQRNKAKVIHEP
jgi:hypothetical protein